MIKEKLRRIQDLYGTYQINEQTLRVANSQGKTASLRRQQVFLKEKIIASLKEIQGEMQPKLFVVCVITPSQTKKTVIMRAETLDDIKTYVQLLALINREVYDIISIDELGTMYQGQVEFIIRTGNERG